MIEIGGQNYYLGEVTLGDYRIIYEFYSYLIQNDRRLTKTYSKLLQVLPKLYRHGFTKNELVEYVDVVGIDQFVKESMGIIGDVQNEIVETFKLHASINEKPTESTNKDNEVNLTEDESITKTRGFIHSIYKLLVLDQQIMTYKDVDNMYISDYLDYMEASVDKSKQSKKVHQSGFKDGQKVVKFNIDDIE